ncbi:MAG TPA: hypothetical protein PKY50_19295 [Candidatus Competibacter sp.]|nr:hypothetical protein [Candidatus Competibacter sp.]
MDYLALQSEILGGPRAAECAPFVNDGSDPSRKSTAPADDQAIAAILTPGRTTPGDALISDGDVAIALGIPAGPLFLYQLEQAANAPTGQSAQEIAIHAVARQAWRSIQRGDFKIGNLTVRAAIDAMIGTLLTADQATAIKALAEIPAPVTAAEVSRAMRGPWGDE